MVCLSSILTANRSANQEPGIDHFAMYSKKFFTLIKFSMNPAVYDNEDLIYTSSASGINLFFSFNLVLRAAVKVARPVNRSNNQLLRIAVSGDAMLFHIAQPRKRFFIGLV